VTDLAFPTRSPMIQIALTVDCQQLQMIERAAATLFPAGRIPDVDDVMPAGDLQKAAEDGLLFIATSGGVAVGFAVAQQFDDSLHLAVMAVHPDHGKRGYGRALVLAVCAEAARRQHARITLTTFEDVPFNAPFYRKAGFSQLSDTQLGPELHKLLAHESTLGMVNRIAMERKLAGPATQDLE
jgi:GNAT superfamily N-acetyltransferase